MHDATWYIGVSLDRITWQSVRLQYPQLVARRHSTGYRIVGFNTKKKAKVTHMNNELQREIQAVRATLSTLNAEQREIRKYLFGDGSASRLPSSRQTERAKQLPGLIFEQEQRLLQLQIEQLEAEAPPLLQRVYDARTAVVEAQGEYDRALKVLREAQDELAKAGVPMTTNDAQRGKLQEELAQLELERGLDLQAERTGKPVWVQAGAHGRPALNQVALDPKMR